MRSGLSIDAKKRSVRQKVLDRMDDVISEIEKDSFKMIDSSEERDEIVAEIMGFRARLDEIRVMIEKISAVTAGDGDA
ncbi:MAG: hypothetical protein HQL19_07995 [Candidatus Omnitrophica bacterium]|nr:hypothetical protein [Candidatus Omnitrophota bacterium]